MSEKSGIRQILLLSLWKQQWHMTFCQRPQSASWLLPTVWLPERRHIFQCGHTEFPSPPATPGNLELNEAWGPLQLKPAWVPHSDLHAYLLHTTDTLQQLCNVHVAKHVAEEATHRVSEQTRPPSPFDSNHNLLGHFWHAEGQKRGAGGNLVSIPLYCHPVDLSNTLFLQFLLDLHFRHAG